MTMTGLKKHAFSGIPHRHYMYYDEVGSGLKAHGLCFLVG